MSDINFPIFFGKKQSGKVRKKGYAVCRVVAQMHRALTGDETVLGCIPSGLVLVCMSNLLKGSVGEKSGCLFLT